MMTFEEFKARTADEILSVMPEDYRGAEIALQEIRKPGRTYTGLTVCLKKGEPTPLIDLEMFYEMLKEDRDYPKILDIMAETAQIRPPASYYGAYEDFEDYSAVRDRLMIRICSAGRDSEYLKDMPHRTVCDLAITYHIAFPLPDGTLSTVPVTREMLASLGVSEEELAENAMASSRRLFPEKIESLSAVVAGLAAGDLPDVTGKELCGEGASGGEELPDAAGFAAGDIGAALVLTTKGMVNGAAALFYPGVMGKIAALAGGDYYVLPSSVHELIILPAAAPLDLAALEETVKMANETCVPPQEVLSDHVYLYSVEKGVLEPVHTEGAGYRGCNGFS